MGYKSVRYTGEIIQMRITNKEEQYRELATAQFWELQELDISKSYLYKLIGKETVVVKTATHRIPTPTPTPEVDSLKKNSTVMTKADSIFGTTKKNPQ